MKDPLSHHNPAPFVEHPAPVDEVTLRAFCTKVIDGDTFDLLIESRPTHILTTERVRLLGVDTPEVYGSRAEPAGRVAKARVEELLMPHKPILVRTNDTRDKYGRLLMEVFYQAESGVWLSLGDTLLAEGLGKEYP